MFGLGQYQREKHDAIWLAIMAMLGALIMLMLGAKLAGATEPQPPRFLPGFVTEWQEGIDHFRGGNFIEARQRLENVLHRVAPGMPIGATPDRGLALWNVLTAQARGQYA